jgi:membrane associated rhomboid family serine protease
MIPLRDILPTRRRPYVTYALIGMNCAVWILQVAQGASGDAFIETWGMTPARFWDEPGWQVFATPLTSMFMHGGWMHIIGNMWFLWIFGDNVEDAFGRWRFVLFYLAGGLCAALLQFGLTLTSPIPMVGASGAIAAVLAAYLCFYPHARVQTLLFLFIFIRIVEIPAFLFIFVWFGFQLLSGCSSLAAAVTGTAWWAHIGGFLAGYLIARWWKKRLLRSGRNLPGADGGMFTFRIRTRGRRPPPPDDLMPPRDGWKS